MDFFLAVLVYVGTGALLGYTLRRIWALLIVLPPLFAGLAWYGWEFSGLASLYVAAILILGYVGLAIGLALRKTRRP